MWHVRSDLVYEAGGHWRPNRLRETELDPSSLSSTLQSLKEYPLGFERLIHLGQRLQVVAYLPASQVDPYSTLEHGWHPAQLAKC